MATTAAPAPAAAVPPASVPAARPNGPARSLLEETGDLTAFSGRSLLALARTPRYASEVLRQAAILIRGTTPLMFAMNVFFGCSIMSFAFFFLRSIGASDYAGLATAFADPRVGAPLMFGYVFTAKVCCGIVAEIGAMKINEEIDAYESTGVDPLRYVVGTRVLGALIFLPIASAVALLAQTAGNFLMGVIILKGVSAQGFLSIHWASQGLQDQVVVFATQGAMALITVLVACFYGMRTSGGPPAVGAAVARSLVVNLVLVHLVTAFFVVLFYGSDLHMSIGG
jgi:phospholipid/cholesterol/gamma-HCH transport system permease protein